MKFHLADLEDFTQDLIRRVQIIKTELERIKKYWNTNNPEVKKMIDKLREEISQANNVFDKISPQSKK